MRRISSILGGISALTIAASFKIPVKTWNSDVAELGTLGLENRIFDECFLNLHHVTDNGNDILGATRFTNRQPDLSPFRTADQPDRIAQPHIGDLHRFTITLGHRQNNVLGPQPSLSC